ncbi:hypothetical protein KY341_04425 [Candidatus Woesearchaeota archaeon]|nr:hypothetical protein [Candidatus Woesearchaeota archaeon]
MNTVTVPRAGFEQMKQELEILRNTKIYKCLLEFESIIAKGKKFTRKALEF